MRLLHNYFFRLPRSEYSELAMTTIILPNTDNYCLCEESRPAKRGGRRSNLMKLNILSEIIEYFFDYATLSLFTILLKKGKN